MASHKLHGVFLPHHKHTADLEAVVMDCPSTVTIPMSMHIGAPAKPIVQVGETVHVGQPIAEAGGFVSAPIHASVSGKVKKLDSVLVSNGKRVPAIVIEADGKQTPYEGLKRPKVNSLEEFLQAVRDSGIVGLGGAGFPTSVKLTVKDLSRIEAVIVNGAECEPYITSDTRTMLDRSRQVLAGARLLQKFLQIKRIIFAIEDNKPQCIAKFRELVRLESGMEVRSLPPLYPQGGEKVLIFHTIGRVVPEEAAH